MVSLPDHNNSGFDHVVFFAAVKNLRPEMETDGEVIATTIYKLNSASEISS